MKTLAAACLLAWSLSVQALTVGPAVVNSSLGEPLRAEFPLTGLTEGQKRDLQARLADESTYEAARLERPPALDGLSLRVETRPDGSHALVLQGQQSVQTAFVDLLVEVRWQGGRLLRALTVLLPPKPVDKPVSLPPARVVVEPAMAPAPLVPVAPVVPAMPALPASTPATPPVAALPKAPASPPARDAREEPAKPADKPAAPPPARATATPAEKASQPTRPAKPEPAKAEPAKPEPAKSESAKPAEKPAEKPRQTSARVQVQPGDTAGRLARDHKAERVTMEQMLLALLQQNPDAFVDGNINRLRSGSYVALPSAAEAGSIEQDAARAALQAQAEAFNAWRAGLSQRVTADDAPDATDGTRLQIPPRLPKQSDTAQDRLELTKPGNSQEDRIALQRQAKDTAERAAELARNIAELGKIAGGQATGTETSPDGVPLPTPDVPEHGRLIDILREHPLTPVGAGVLVALLVLMSLWRTRVRSGHADPLASETETGPDAASLSEPVVRSPFPVDFDLNLPRLDTPLAEDPPVVPSMSSSTSASPAPRPESGSPLAGLSLDLPTDLPADNGNFPFAPQAIDPVLQVRLDLAQALWEAGQTQTARLLAEEVAEQARGQLQSMAREWLASHA